MVQVGRADGYRWAASSDCARLGSAVRCVSGSLSSVACRPQKCLDLSERKQWAAAQRCPPPWDQQHRLRDCALLEQPVKAQRRPPPWLRQSPRLTAMLRHAAYNRCDTRTSDAPIGGSSRTQRPRTCYGDGAVPLAARLWIRRSRSASRDARGGVETKPGRWLPRRGGRGSSNAWETSPDSMMRARGGS